MAKNAFLKDSQKGKVGGLAQGGNSILSPCPTVSHNHFSPGASICSVVAEETALEG